jgi:hypothetical protein
MWRSILFSLTIIFMVGSLRFRVHRFRRMHVEIMVTNGSDQYPKSKVLIASIGGVQSRGGLDENPDDAGPQIRTTPFRLACAVQQVEGAQQVHEPPTQVVQVVPTGRRRPPPEGRRACASSRRRFRPGGHRPVIDYEVEVDDIDVDSWLYAREDMIEDHTFVDDATSHDEDFSEDFKGHIGELPLDASPLPAPA